MDQLEIAEWYEKYLTDEADYDRTTPSRMTGKTQDARPAFHVKHGSQCETFELPIAAHDGVCYIALNLGEVVDTCECLDRFELEMRADGR